MPRIGTLGGTLILPLGAVDVAQIAGVIPQMDDTDKLATSLYARAVAPGDSELEVESAARHNLKVGIWDGAERLALPVPAIDGVPVATRSVGAVAFGHAFNGTLWDRHRNNWTEVVLPSAARGASINSDDQVNYDHPHFLLTVNITVQTAAETIQLAVELIDPVSGTYSNVWTAAAAIGAVGTYTYLLGPAAVAAVYTEDVHIVMPRDWRLVVTQVGVGPITYSVAVSYIGH